MKKPLLLIGLLLLSSCVKTVKIGSNNIGIFVDDKDNVTDTTSVFYPGSYVFKYSQKIVQIEVSRQTEIIKMNAVLKDGISIKLDFTLFFQPVFEKTPLLYSKYKKDYVNPLVLKTVNRVLSNGLKKYSSSEIPTDEFEIGKLLFDMIENKEYYSNLIKILDVVFVKYSFDSVKPDIP